MDYIVKYLSEYIEIRGIRQAFIARKIGMNKNALSNTLAGRRKLLADEYIKLCDALDVDIKAISDMAIKEMKK